MSLVYIDTDAVQAAQNALKPIVDQTCYERDRHQQLHDFVRGALLGVSHSFVIAPTPDEIFQLWQNLSLDHAVSTCRSSWGTVDTLRGSAETALRQLCEAHGGTLDAVIADHSADLRPSYTNAIDGMARVMESLTPDNLLGLLFSPWSLFDALWSVRAALDAAASVGDGLHGFMETLKTDEQRVWATLQRTFSGPSVTATPAPDRTGITPNGHATPEVPATTMPATDAIKMDPVFKSAILAGASVVNATALVYASHLAAVLDSDGGHPPRFDHLNEQRVESDPLLKGKYDEVERILRLHGWSDSDVQCVALVYISLELARATMPVSLAGDNGNAENWMGTLSTDSHWLEIPNVNIGGAKGQTLPKPGDLITMQVINDTTGLTAFGHIGIVYQASPGQIDFYQANSPGIQGHFRIDNGVVVGPHYYDGTLNSMVTFQIQGFIQYVGP